MTLNGVIATILVFVSYSAAYMLYVVADVEWVRGVTYLDNILYVVFAFPSTIRLYNTDTLSRLRVVINVKRMLLPCDIVVCRHDRQLYVADEACCIWRVSVDDHSYVKWLTESSADIFHVNSLSLTSRRLLVTSLPWPPHDSPAVRQYSTTNKERLHVVQLPQYVEKLWHAVETTHDTFVICHRGTSQSKGQHAVSELFRICYVLQH